MFISEVVKKGWDEAKKSFWFFVGVIVLFVVLIAIISMASTAVINRYMGNGFVGFVVGVVNIILTSYLSIGLILIGIKKAKNESTSIGDLFVGFPYVASYIGASVIYFLIVLAGFILLIFPGVVWSIKYGFYPYLIIDKKMKAIESIKASAKITHGFKWDILGVWFVIELIGILGFFCLLIGLFWTIPLVLVSSALVYLKLAEKL